MGAPMTLGSMTFEAPDDAAGWKTSTVKGGVLFQKEIRPKDGRGRKAAAIIQVLGPFPGSPATLDKGFETVVGLVKGMAAERPMRKTDGKTSNGHRIRTDYRCCTDLKGLSASQWTVGMSSEKHQVAMTLLGLDLRGDARDAVEAEFKAMVRSVSLAPADKPFGVVPSAGEGGLDGVYTHLNTGVRPNVFGGTDFYSDSEITVFDRSGLYATEIPKGGDLAAHCRATPTECGVYKLIGGGLFGGATKIEMRAVKDGFGTIEAETKPFARKGDDLSIDDGDYRLLKPFPAGTTFNGSWRYFFASAGTTALSSGSVSSEKILQLSSNGTFRRTGWSGASTTNDTGGGTTGVTTGSARPAASGRYQISGHTMTLTGDDGRTERLSVFAPDRGSDKLLVIDGSNYLKRE
ncbi:hypothetical protein FXN63_26230 [Pigmentiphaga aceris]|uniref:Uncharacterized protein n=1 Tax=Pigmentiphaga aceris TaxID=1940612 RepID=A0A5C0B3V9_9BURK|nr:hypothetical protein FXN63_26230 [Pigmentiphaga aceris]